MAQAHFQPVHVIGGGLAGAEAAWQIAASALPVVLHEMRPLRMTAAHKTVALAELVCSNSFRADANQVPAGAALAVDREGFAAAVTAALDAHPLIDIRREEVATIPPAAWDSVIIATGPLTSPALA